MLRGRDRSRDSHPGRAGRTLRRARRTSPPSAAVAPRPIPRSAHCAAPAHGGGGIGGALSLAGLSREHRPHARDARKSPQGEYVSTRALARSRPLQAARTWPVPSSTRLTNPSAWRLRARGTQTRRSRAAHPARRAGARRRRAGIAPGRAPGAARWSSSRAQPQRAGQLLDHQPGVHVEHQAGGARLPGGLGGPAGRGVLGHVAGADAEGFPALLEQVPRRRGQQPAGGPRAGVARGSRRRRRRAPPAVRTTRRRCCCCPWSGASRVHCSVPWRRRAPELSLLPGAPFLNRGCENVSRRHSSLAPSSLVTPGGGMKSR